MKYWQPCPQCKDGTLEVSRSLRSDYMHCLNCGFYYELPDNCNTVGRIRSELVSLYQHYGAREVAAADGTKLAA